MSKPPFILGIDIGGTGAKAALLSLDGEAKGQGYVEYGLTSTVPGQAEHDAEGWWTATVSAIRAAIAGVDPHDIVAVGVGCTNGLVAVDRAGRPLRPAIMLWDQRALPEVERLGDTLGGDEVFAVTGNPLAPGAYSLPTMLWLKENEPEVFDAAHKLMVPGGYLVMRLTGEATIDHSRACTTLLFDIRRLEWHQPFLDALGIPQEKLPLPLRSEEVAGTVSPDAAQITGLAAGTPVVAGCMDTIGASLGSGMIDPGECFIIMGTAARVASPLGEPVFDRRFMNCAHVLPDRWLTIGAINGVGSSLRWVRDTMGEAESARAGETGQDVYDLLTAQAAAAPPGSKGLVFLPYISGERTPIWNPYARGVFFGVTLGHDRSDLLRSVLEGAAFALRQAVEILETERRLEIRAIRIGGAAGSNPVWNQIIADVLGKTVVSLGGEHTEVLGAALLAGVGVGAYPSYQAAVEATVATDREYPPDAAAHDAYNRLFPVYEELYWDVEHHFERLARLDLPQVWVTGRE